jgi:hypothetical protein
MDRSQCFLDHVNPFYINNSSTYQYCNSSFLMDEFKEFYLPSTVFQVPEFCLFVVYNFTGTDMVPYHDLFENVPSLNIVDGPSTVFWHPLLSLYW